MDNQPGEAPATEDESGLRLSVAIDPRLVEVWSCLFSADLDSEELAGQVGWFLRMAYLRGYHDGLCEPEVGSLYRELGVRVPPRRRPLTTSTNGGAASGSASGKDEQ